MQGFRTADRLFTGPTTSRASMVAQYKVLTLIQPSATLS
jgi:hypothetical protein